jgi:hypothetical protein
MMCDSILKLDEADAIIDANIKNPIPVDSITGDCIPDDIAEEDPVEEAQESDEYESGIEDSKISFIAYDLEEEQNLEMLQNEYHIDKSNGDWYYAKMIVSHGYQDKNNTEFFCDHIERLLQKNADSFDNIQTSYYKNDLDIDIIYQFAAEPAKHLIDNLRIPAFKPDGIIFANPEDANKWSFKIVVITSKGIYTANRYITEELIGFY